MDREPSEQQRDPVVSAIDEVLRAERAAEAMLQDCREQAGALIAAARERATTITRGADARISRLHAAYLGKISAQISTLSDTPDAKACSADTAIGDVALADAAQRLAAQLTGEA